MATDTVIKLRIDAGYLCECGSVMEYVDDDPEIARRLIFCDNSKCPLNGKQYYEPVFVARDPAMGLDDGSL